ncbi:MAG: hypothetical protein AB7D29_07900 [Campylobacterales bacterium]
MNKNFLLAIFCVLTLSGCASKVVDVVSYDSNTSARMRIFGMNGIATYVYTGLDRCDISRSSNVIKASGGIKDSLKSLLLSRDSHSIGIPSSDRVKNPHHGILSNEFYNEYVIPANKLTTVKASFNSGPGSVVSYCDTISRTFFAEPGRDYEAFLTVKGGYCMLTVQAVENTGETNQNIKNITCQ